VGEAPAWQRACQSLSPAHRPRHSYRELPFIVPAPP